MRISDWSSDVCSSDLVAIIDDEAAARDWLRAAFDPTPAGWARLERYAAMLVAENAQQNLVAASTIPTLWTRHIADSAPLLALDAREGEIGRASCRERVCQYG